ncbi:MAG: hypothetical protein ACE5G2_07675 [Candidatus Krumholzibacteriia bacterium]
MIGRRVSDDLVEEWLGTGEWLKCIGPAISPWVGWPPLKVLRRDLDPEQRRRFLREARASAKLQHPAIATFHETGEFADTRQGPTQARHETHT